MLWLYIFSELQDAPTDRFRHSKDRIVPCKHHSMFIMDFLCARIPSYSLMMCTIPAEHLEHFLQSFATSCSSNPKSKKLEKDARRKVTGIPLIKSDSNSVACGLVATNCFLKDRNFQERLLISSIARRNISNLNASNLKVS